MNDLDRLKNILFGHEKRALDAITRRLDTPESRAADVADVLPDAFSQSYARDPRLAKVLQQPLQVTMTEAIRRDPKSFADALFPVMGPAIRKSISEALKSVVQSLNRAVDTSLSPSARFKAWRAGVPLGEWVLSQSLVYRVDQVYLIKSDNGLLISHLHHQDATQKDEDAVSAMLTAIQDFVRDSFSEGQSGSLDSAVIGEYTVWISHGPHAMLACVVRGVPPAGLREEMTATIERIHLSYGDSMIRFMGNTDPIPGIEHELENCLRIELKDEAEEGKSGGLPMPVLVVLALLAAGFIYVLANGYIKNKRLAAWADLLNAAPGIVTTELVRDGGKFVARGLRDPIAADPLELATQAGIPAEAVSTDYRPFQSLESDIVIARSRGILDPPTGVEFALTGSTLVATGIASEEWRNQIVNLAPAIGGIDRVDMSGLKPDDRELLARIRQAVTMPPDVELFVRNGEITMNGKAPQKWIAALPAKLGAVSGLTGSNLTGLTPIELGRIRQLARAIDGQELFFAAGDTLEAGQQAKLTLLASQMRRFSPAAIALDLVPEFGLTGFSDGTGSRRLNLEMQIKRAEAVKLSLVTLGVDPNWLFVRGAALSDAEAEPNPSLRKARVDIRTTTSDGRSLISP